MASWLWVFSGFLLGLLEAVISVNCQLSLQNSIVRLCKFTAILMEN